MTEQKLDELLKDLYQREGTVPKDWNERLLEKQKSSYKLPRYRHGVAAAILLLCLIGISGSVYAAYHYLTPAQTAEEMEMNKLAEKFAQQEDEVLSVKTKGYYINYLGILTGKNLADGLEGAEVDKEKTYIVTAIQKEDGTAMTYSDHFFIGPFIKGLNPIHYNITQNGSSATRMIDHGILYCISECDTIGIFAKRGIYLVIQEGRFYDAEAYSMDEKTGVLTANKEYEKVNVLFEIKLDESMADEEKAQAYIDEIDKEASEPTKEDNSDTIDVTFPSDSVATYEDATVTLHTFGRVGLYNNIRLRVGEEITINFLPEVKGKNIKNVTFNVHGGKFYAVDKLSRKEADKQKEEIDYDFTKHPKYRDIYSGEAAEDKVYYGMYKKGTSSICIPAKGNKASAHFALRISKEFDDDVSYDKMYKELLKKLDNVIINMEIRKQDGSVIRKKIRCRSTIYYTYSDDNFTKDFAYYEYLLPQLPH